MYVYGCIGIYQLPKGWYIPRFGDLGYRITAPSSEIINGFAGKSINHTDGYMYAYVYVYIHYI